MNIKQLGISNLSPIPELNEMTDKNVDRLQTEGNYEFR